MTARYFGYTGDQSGDYAQTNSVASGIYPTAWTGIRKMEGIEAITRTM